MRIVSEDGFTPSEISQIYLKNYGERVVLTLAYNSYTEELTLGQSYTTGCNHEFVCTTTFGVEV